jgi:hypothetical protein
VDAQTFFSASARTPHSTRSMLIQLLPHRAHSQAQPFLQPRLCATVFSASTRNVHRVRQVGNLGTRGRNQQVCKSRTPRTYSIGRLQYAPLYFVCFFDNAVTDFAVSNAKTIQEWWPGKDVDGSGRNLFKLTYRYLPGKTERTAT